MTVDNGDLTVIVLAAGGGTRMKSKLPKVLHPLCGRTMVGHVLAAVTALEPANIVAVVGHQRELVGPAITAQVPQAQLAVQSEQLGTGHAAQVAVAELGWDSPSAQAGVVLVTTADTPLLQAETLAEFVAAHRSSADVVSVLSGMVADPTGYGRIIRDQAGKVTAIVEHKDATVEQLAVTEINSGILAFDREFLTQALPQLENTNAAGEFYLTDLVGIAQASGKTVGAVPVADVTQTEGANNRVQLAQLGAILNQRILTHWMLEGVTIVDPASTFIDVQVELAPDVILQPGVQLLGATTVGEDAVIGPDSTVIDTQVGRGASLVRTHAVKAVVGEGATVGPFAHLRADTVLGTDAKIGGFVETKNASLGTGAKVPHLTYVGDAQIGEGANIGAGSVFANYDGVKKHHTVIGAHAKTASNTTFVAPVQVGDGAGTGAGSVIREDVPPGALAVSAGPQRNIDGWALRRRAGTAQAKAAEQALEKMDVAVTETD